MKYANISKSNLNQNPL